MQAAAAAVTRRPIWRTCGSGSPNARGVEAYVEPKTTVTDVTVVLVAADGEWTRRRAGGDAGARRLSERLNIPVYDVQKVGYPQRMRDYDARRRIERERAVRRELEDR